MSKKQRNAKMNQHVKNATMEQKFKKVFSKITVGIVVLALTAIASIIMLCVTLAKNGVSNTFGIVTCIILFLMVCANIILCRSASKNLTVSIIEPIGKLRKAVHQLNNGDFDIHITYEGKDEFGELVGDLQETCIKIHAVITDAGFLLGEMAEGRFNVTSHVKENYVGNFEVLLEAMRKLKHQLNGTLTQIKEASEQVMVGAEQLSDSAQELAEGATNQASAVEELTATIGNVTNISEKSAYSAVSAADNAKASSEDAKKSREEITQLTEAMERITETSKEIENIITTIEDIASQTNLLSLNASIEAARAGEAGKGFAVVADQIGNLAAGSAQSAVTTRELISKSLAEIEIGNQIVEHTMETIDTVLKSMDAFAEIASGAAEASRAQANMLKEIETGIDQISTVVQNNSAFAEETSAVSEELSAQSVSLQEMIGKFELFE